MGRRTRAGDQNYDEKITEVTNLGALVVTYEDEKANADRRGRNVHEVDLRDDEIERLDAVKGATARND